MTDERQRILDHMKYVQDWLETRPQRKPLHELEADIDARKDSWERARRTNAYDRIYAIVAPNRAMPMWKPFFEALDELHQLDKAAGRIL